MCDKILQTASLNASVLYNM